MCTHIHTRTYVAHATRNSEKILSAKKNIKKKNKQQQQLTLLPYLKRSHPIMRLPLTVNRPASAPRKTTADSWTKEEERQRSADVRPVISLLSLLALLALSLQLLLQQKLRNRHFYVQLPTGFARSLALFHSRWLPQIALSLRAAAERRSCCGCQCWCRFFCTPTTGSGGVGVAVADGDWSLYLFLMVRVLELL